MNRTSPSTSPSRLANTCQHSNYTSIGDEVPEADLNSNHLDQLEQHQSLISFDDSVSTSSSDDVITSDFSEEVPVSHRYHPRPLLLEDKELPNRFTYLHCVLLFKLYLIMSLFLFSVILLLTFAVKDSGALVSSSNDSSVDNGTSSSSAQQTPTTFQISLDPENQFRVFWSVDKADESVVFELRIVQHQQQQLNWFAFGFSSYGQIEEADLCLLWFDKRGKLWFDDIKTDNESFVLADLQSNDCRLIKAKRDHQHKILRVAFRRQWDTCDPEDYVIDSGTTHLVWATGPGPLSRIEALRLKNFRHGFTRSQLLKPPSATHLPKLPYYIKKLEVLHSNITVPTVETTYWCRVVKIPEVDFSVKNHIVQYEAVIAPGSEHLVHHMELFHCEVNVTEVKELPFFNGHCEDPKMPKILKACKRVIAAWAMGASPMTYPKHVGLPVGGPDYSPYVMLEMHYNNPQLASGVVDSSGIRLYYTDHLRQTDAGILEIGLEYTDKNSIPPRVVMDLKGYCVSECTRAALPPFGITIFASQLHTHLTGVRTWTAHVRGGVVVDELNRDDHYSSHFQEIRRLPAPITVFPGDALINVCRYDTRERANVTLGGFGIRDEMCVNYLHYYPKVGLEVCKSSVDTASLRQYFKRMREEEGQNTSEAFSVADNYHAIQWNAKRAAELDRFYQLAPLSMQCNRSDGRRFPGYWNGVPVTRVTTPLKAKPRKCHWTMKKLLTENLMGGSSRKSILEDDEDGGVQANEDEDVEEEELKIESAHRKIKRGRSMYKRSPVPSAIEEELREMFTKRDKENGRNQLTNVEEEAEKALMLEIAAEV